MGISSELGHLAMPTNFLALWKNQMAQESFEPGPLDPDFYALPLCHTGYVCRCRQIVVVDGEDRIRRALWRRSLTTFCRRHVLTASF